MIAAAALLNAASTVAEVRLDAKTLRPLEANGEAGRLIGVRIYFPEWLEEGTRRLLRHNLRYRRAALRSGMGCEALLRTRSGRVSAAAWVQLVGEVLVVRFTPAPPDWGIPTIDEPPQRGNLRLVR